MNCYLHSDREAIGTCVSCGKFICNECKTEILGKNYCKSCVNDLMSDKNKQIEKAENKQQAPMVFMNSSSSSAASSSSSGMMRRPYPRQSLGVHILLFIFTAGIGNIIYFLYIRAKQKEWKQQ